jgi:hypothetical protein
MKKFLILGLALSLALSILAADVIVTGYRDPDFSTDTVVPFGVSGFGVRYQQVYASSIFSPISPGGGWITNIEVAFDPPTFEVGFITSVQINLSTTLRTPDGLSTTFAENIGSDDTVVLGPNRIGLAQSGGLGLPVPIYFERPFYYDPDLGNLLMDVRLVQDGPSVGGFDATVRAGDPVSSVYAIDVNALIADRISTVGLDTAFVIVPVPEPASLALLAVGLAALSLWCRQHKHNTPTQKDRTWR